MNIRFQRGRNCYLRKIILLAAVFIAAMFCKPPATAFAFNVTPINMVEMYTTSGTPVYAVPDVFSPVVIYLDRFVNVRVYGITDNGFFQVDLNGTFYIPGPYMVSQISEAKTEKQKALENLGDFAEAYRILLEQMASYSENFALIDVTGDGIPELFDASGKEIYTYYNEPDNERAVMMYYSEYPVTFYYSKKDNVLLGKYTWNKNEIWEVYAKDVSLLPWGQFKCISTAASSFKGNATSISREYKNDAETRADLYNILKKILEL